MTTADRAAGGGVTRVERFVAHLDALTGGTEPRFLPVASTKAGLPGVTVMGYRGRPEPGMFTAVTFGPATRARHSAMRAAASFQGIDASLSWALTIKSPAKFDAACQRARRLPVHRRELGMA